MLTAFRFARGPRMTALTRGPLPARVYWTRRVLVLGTALLLVFGLARLLVGGSDASSAPEPQAVQAAAEPTGTTSTSAGPESTHQARKHKKKDKVKEPVLAEPQGTCLDTDIAVTPGIEKATAGQSVFFVLELRTISAAACTWRVSPESLSVKVTSGDDYIWSTRECPRAIPTKDVVVRSAVSTKVGIRWSGRRSDRDCSRLTDWALPGWYHIAAAALAGEPSEKQFELERPKPQVITETAQPDHKGRKTRHRDKPQGQQVKHR